MADFQLDTSGRVECPASFQPLGWAIWSDLTPFAQGYVEAMVWAVCVEEDGGRCLREYAFSDLAPATLARIIGDCEYVTATMRGQDRHVRELAEEGAAYWRTRQDRGSYGLSPLTVFLADDGLIYLREAS